MTKDEGLPLVVVVYDNGAATPLEILSGADGICELYFLYDSSRPGVAEVAEFVEELADSHDFRGQDLDQVAEHVRALAPAGVLTFSEYALRFATELADRLGMRGHDLATLDRLTRKSAQRRRLAEVGVDAVRYESVRTLEEAGRAIDLLGPPVVLKPAVGTHSRDTFRIDDHDDWKAVAETLAMREEFVVEELLVGDPSWTGSQWGDHVSVEHVSFEGEHQHVVTLGKFPLAEPFRETGDFYPSTLDPETLARVNELAARAVDALGVRYGITHTEVKFTAAGPKIIEVNGRLGGGVADIVRKAGGRDPIAMAFEVVLGRRPQPATPPDGDVVFEMSVLSPQDRVRVTRVRGLDGLRAMDGVDRIVAVARPGSVVDWRVGSVSQLCTMYGHAADHDGLEALRTAIHQTYACDFLPAPAET
ncbi:acetyl-CoA carboxylase biotin carboxylase subunit family protein [Micromonospora sp. RV43]|uniref:ATP-grasp domain-containing protein n=1 Tax=Micromonospora sp. RV43 TaxID=1661387 RepID=UPI00069EC2EF|nr:ATP-grasp domain-containing protein [Micromonospora sp. RV43]